MKKLICFLTVILSASIIPPIDGQTRLATQDEQSSMLGRLLGAIEDVGAGEHPPVDQKYIKEALKKLSSINKDIDKLQYSARLRWLAHHWYGRALLDSGDAKKALPLLEAAENEAKSSAAPCTMSDSCISDQEKAKNIELLRLAGEKTTPVPN